MANRALLPLIVALGLLAQGCDGPSCTRACRKLASCMGIDTDKGIGYAAGTGTSKSATSKSGSDATVKPVAWTCSLSKECSAKEACYARCMDKASCAALTSKDQEGYQELMACQTACDTAKYDGGRHDGITHREKGACTPQCAGKECGEDGCGSVCGLCIHPQICGASGKCSTTCTPSCTGKQCGDDGCGGSCGTCTTGKKCDYGVCVTGCTPSCSGKVCGADGCGGSCGSCSTGKICDSYGQCISSCTPSCSSRVCGSDGCGGSCGTCATGKTCDSYGQCISSCTPSCTSRVCGSDGCGGSCGTCATGKTCDSYGQCVTTTTGCGSITDIGCCSGTTLKYCSGTQVVTSSCSSSPSCGWSSANGYYDCGTAGGSDPSGTYPRTCP